MAGINVTKLKSIAIYAPPLHLQEEFAAFVQKVDKTKSTFNKASKNSNSTTKALNANLFRMSSSMTNFDFLKEQKQFSSFANNRYRRREDLFH